MCVCRLIFLCFSIPVIISYLITSEVFIFLFQLNTVQSQMQTKGGYDYVTPVTIHLNCVDLPVHNQS